MDHILILISIGIGIITLVLLFTILTKSKVKKDDESAAALIRIETLLTRLDTVLREEMSTTRSEQSMRLKEFERSLMEQLISITKTNNEVVSKLSEIVDKKLEDVKITVNNNLKDIQKGNEEKLEKMRQTVDEKLHETLEKRLGESFKIVSERLDQVHKGLGEMQNLAVSVGDLKKVLSNVKTRGIVGEIQLENILEQILSPEQYDKNVSPKLHSDEVVEFAVKLPGKESDGDPVYLPIDSKFPVEAYHRLQEAYDRADAEEVAKAGKEIEMAIKKSAKDIRDKYINPPKTTDFGIMFLPVEGLYAEVVRRPALLETLQRDFKIVITGPTTLAALLNSLQMGFKTLAIEERSSEVWMVLSAVKTEFNKFGDVLEKAQRKINDAGTEIEKLVGTRSKKILRQLNQVSELKQNEANGILALDGFDTSDDEEEVAGA